MQVTIVIPTFKRVEYLKQAIKSICQQTYPDFNCLVVNDYPPDSSILEKAITEFNDPRLHLINHESSCGGNTARNTGIKQATGEIIAFLDDDDYWLPNKLQRHLERHRQNPQVGLVFSGLIKRWDEDLLPPKTFGATIPSCGVIEGMSQGKFCPGTTSSVTVRRECFEQCGLFDSNLVSFQDWDMWYRIALDYDFDCIDEALIVFRQHLGDRTSRAKERRLQGLEQLVEKWQSNLTDAQHFQATFVKDTYVSSVYHSILQSQTITALQDWYKLLKLSKQPSDVFLLFKLILMLVVQDKVYSFMSRLYKS